MWYVRLSKYNLFQYNSLGQQLSSDDILNFLVSYDKIVSILPWSIAPAR